MAAARIDLTSPPFRRAVRGFDPHDVQAFLDLIASDYEEAYAERARMREAVATLTRELEGLRETERTLMQTLSSAAQAAEAQTAAAHTDAERVLADAHARAAALLGAHDDWCRGVDAEIAGMRRKQGRALEALTALLDELELGGDVPVAPVSPPSEAALLASSAVGRELEAPALGPAKDEPAATPVVPPIAAPASPAVVEWPGATDHDPEADAWAPAFELPATSRLDEPFDDEEFEEVALPNRRRSVARWASVGAVLLVATCVAVVAWPGAGEAPSGATRPAAVEPPAAVVAAEIEEPASDEPVLTDPLVVRLAAARECWVRLTVDGRPETLLMAPGEHLTRGAKRAIDLRAGDAAALSVTVNGRELGPLGRDGQVVERRFEATGN